MIDLHMHTTASDGRCAPPDLVARVQAAGLTTFAITDHDTVAGERQCARGKRRVAVEFRAPRRPGPAG